MYTLDFTVKDWHEGLVANLDNPKIYGVNRENLTDQIRIFLDLEEEVTYTLDFKSAGAKWFRLQSESIQRGKKWQMSLHRQKRQ